MNTKIPKDIQAPTQHKRKFDQPEQDNDPLLHPEKDFKATPEDDDDDPLDEHGAEEWERHESRNYKEIDEEYLYETELELKWEKGGSGLVFYTDAFLREQEKYLFSPYFNIL